MSGTDVFKSVFTVENTIAPITVRWNGKEDLKSIKFLRKHINRLLMGLDPYQAHGPGGLSYMFSRSM